MIPVQVTKNIYIGDGQNKQWPFTFRYDEASDVKVALYDIQKDKQTVLTKDYFVDTEKNVVFYPGYVPGQEPPIHEWTPILTANEKIIIYRETSQSQDEDLGDRYPLHTLEGMADKNTMLIQELNEKVDRSVKAPIGHSEDVDTEKLGEMLAQTLTAKDKAQASADAAAASEVTAIQSAHNAAQSSTLAGKSAQEAAASAQAVKAEAYSQTKTYNFPDTVAYTDGYTYRCIGQNIMGEDPSTSANWVRLVVIYDSFFDIDAQGGLMPGLNPTYNAAFELDSNSDIMPKIS